MTPSYQALKSWLKDNPFVFVVVENQSLFNLTERATAKSLSFDVNAIKDFRVRQHPQGLGAYLNLIFESGLEIVLCHAGVAFSPSFKNTGFLQDAPPVVCFQDYALLNSQLSHLMSETPTPDRKILATLAQVMISILDGAREVGFDVSPEEALLEQSLTKIEGFYK